MPELPELVKPKLNGVFHQWACAGAAPLGLMLVVVAGTARARIERAGRLIGAATTFLQNAGFARSRSDLLCEEAVLDALHRRLPADAVNTLVQQGRDTPLEEVLADALEETART